LSVTVVAGWAKAFPEDRRIARISAAAKRLRLAPPREDTLTTPTKVIAWVNKPFSSIVRLEHVGG